MEDYCSMLTHLCYPWVGSAHYVRTMTSRAYM